MIKSSNGECGIAYTMERIIKFIIIFLILLSGCSRNRGTSPHVSAAHEAMQTFAKEMEKEFDLVCIGSGGRMPSQIEEIQVSFAAYRKGEISEARSLEILGTEKLVQIINRNEKIRPYLKKHPIDHAQAIVSISFREKNETRFDGVSLVFQANDQIYYCGKDPGNELLIEPYEEARNKILLTREVNITTPPGK